VAVVIFGGSDDPEASQPVDSRLVHVPFREVYLSSGMWSRVAKSTTLSETIAKYGGNVMENVMN
jgi:hypothetical protein